MQQRADLMAQSCCEILALMDNTELQVYTNQWIVVASIQRSLSLLPPQIISKNLAGNEFVFTH